MAFLVPVLFPSLVAGTAAYVFAGAALSFGGSLVLSKMAGNFAKSQSGRSQSASWGGINVAARVAAAPREMVYGKVRHGGTIVYMATSGAKNQYLHLVIALATHRVKAINGVYFGSKLAINAAGVAQDIWAGRGKSTDDLPSSWFEYGESNLVFIEKNLGAVDQAAFDALRAAKPQDWTADHRLQGVACVHLRLAYAPSAFPNGIPDISFDIEGCDEVYDPRTATTGYSQNAALCIAHHMAHPFGFGTAIGAADGINEDALIEAANICDEDVALAAGGTEKRYALNGVVSLSKDPMTRLREMMSAMAGTKAEIGGQHHIHAGAYRAPVAALTLADARGPLRITTRISQSENFNAVRGKFVSPDNDWQPDDFPPYASAVYAAEDNGEVIWRDIELPFTTSASTAQRLAKIELERARRQISLPFSAGVKSWAVPVGEVVTLDHPRRGWVEKPFLVVQSRINIEGGEADPMLQCDMVLQETSPLIYDWTASEEAIYAAAPRSTLPSAFDAPAAPGILSAVEALYSTRDGAGVKTQIALEWSASASASAVEYRVQGKLGSGEWVEYPITRGASTIIADIDPGDWVFRVAAVNQIGVQSDWSALYAVQVLGLLAPPAALQSVASQSIAGLVVLSWALHPDLDVRIGGQILMRQASSVLSDWNAARPIGAVAGAMSQAVVPLMQGAYLLRAQDSSGLLGPVAVIGADGSEVLNWSLVAVLDEAPAFSGAKDGTAVLADALELDGDDVFDNVPNVDALPRWDRPNGAASGGVYNFASRIDLPAAKSMRLRAETEFLGNLVEDVFDARAGTVDSWPSWDGETGDVGVDVQVRITPDDPAGSPVWSDWQSLIVSEVFARGVEARVVLITENSDFSPRVTMLRVIAQEIAA